MFKVKIHLKFDNKSSPNFCKSPKKIPSPPKIFLSSELAFFRCFVSAYRHFSAEGIFLKENNAGGNHKGISEIPTNLDRMST